MTIDELIEEIEKNAGIYARRLFEQLPVPVPGNGSTSGARRSDSDIKTHRARARRNVPSYDFNRHINSLRIDMKDTQSTIENTGIQ